MQRPSRAGRPQPPARGGAPGHRGAPLPLKPARLCCGQPTAVVCLPCASPRRLQVQRLRAEPQRAAVQRPAGGHRRRAAAGPDVRGGLGGRDHRLLWCGLGGGAAWEGTVGLTGSAAGDAAVHEGAALWKHSPCTGIPLPCAVPRVRRPADAAGRPFEARNKAKGGAFTGDEKEFFRFKLGDGSVIPAFEEAVAGMKVCVCVCVCVVGIGGYCGGWQWVLLRCRGKPACAPYLTTPRPTARCPTAAWLRRRWAASGASSSLWSWGTRIMITTRRGPGPPPSAVRLGRRGGGGEAAAPWRVAGVVCLCQLCQRVSEATPAWHASSPAAGQRALGFVLGNQVSSARRHCRTVSVSCWVVAPCVGVAPLPLWGHSCCTPFDAFPWHSSCLLQGLIDKARTWDALQAAAARLQPGRRARVLPAAGGTAAAECTPALADSCRAASKPQRLPALAPPQLLLPSPMPLAPMPLADVAV